MHTQNRDWENELLQEVSQHYAQAEATLLDFLRIPSVQETATPDAPFGEPVRQALSQMAAWAKELGLQVNQTSHYLTIDLGDGASPEAVGILAHADVVPFGEGWHFAPTGQLVANKIYGRGALDDKGPAIATLFAMAALHRLNAPLSRPVRLIIGGNEESGCECIKKYAAENQPPALGFSPDANFPVIFAEKGIAMYHITLPAITEQQRLLELQAGTVVNAVPGKAEAVLNLTAAKINQILQNNFARELTAGWLEVQPLPEDTAKITCLGKAAHGSQPDKGRNAAALLLHVLSNLPLNDAELNACRQLYQLFGRDYWGEAAGLATADEVSGQLTLNLGILKLQDNAIQIDLDLRYPVTSEYNAIYQQLTKVCTANGWQIRESEHKAPLYVPTDQKPVTTLLELYREYEPQTQPISTGGGTYCRAFDNFVAFGPLRADMADVMHQADEYITREDFQFLQRIYTQAIWRLAGDK